MLRPVTASTARDPVTYNPEPIVSTRFDAAKAKIALELAFAAAGMSAGQTVRDLRIALAAAREAYVFTLDLAMNRGTSHERAARLARRIRETIAADKAARAAAKAAEVAP